MFKSNQASILFCETCKGQSFKLELVEPDVLLICQKCDRPYMMEKARIIDPSGGPNVDKSITWNWSKSVWDPL